MKKTILQYMTDIYQEDIPKHILQENKIRLNSFFLEQESVQKKGTQFIFRYAFYSVEKPHEAASIERICRGAFGKKERTTGTNTRYEAI
jgi:hypothetical protein